MKRTIDARTGLEIIDPDECRRLLATEEVGRLAVVDGGTPLVFPVNYGLDGDTLVFRTVPGTKLSAGRRGPVAFEIDRIEPSTRRGWSVLVVGHLEEVDQFDAAALERTRSVPVEPWSGGDTPHWMRLVPRRVTGRRITSTA